MIPDVFQMIGHMLFTPIFGMPIILVIVLIKYGRRILSALARATGAVK